MTTETSSAQPFFQRWPRIPGALLAIAIAILATLAGSALPIVGGPVFGILFGIILGAGMRHPVWVAPGAGFAGSRILQASIVLFGTGLSLREVANVGVRSLPIMLSTIAVALIGAWLIGRAFGVSGELRTLIGVGTAICGASAIAAVSSVIRPKPGNIAYAIGTIFTFNILAVLTFPWIGHLLGLSSTGFGLWAGTAINDTSSVVAAGFTFSAAAGAFAVVVKLTRTLMIIPITLGLSWWTARNSVKTSATLTAAHDDTTAAPQDGPGRIRFWQVVPWFLVGFLVACIINTIGLIPTGFHPALSTIGVFMITVAMSGIGINTNVDAFRQAGTKPLFLGGILWVLVAVTSLLVQFAVGAH